jgi:hypothetical protein
VPPGTNLAPVSVPGLFLCRCGDGKGGSHPFDVDVRCHVFAERWLGEEGSLLHPVEPQYLSDRSAPITSVQTATAASTIEPSASLILSEYRRVFRMCEVKD